MSTIDLASSARWVIDRAVLFDLHCSCQSSSRATHHHPLLLLVSTVSECRGSTNLRCGVPCSISTFPYDDSDARNHTQSRTGVQIRTHITQYMVEAVPIFSSNPIDLPRPHEPSEALPGSDRAHAELVAAHLAGRVRACWGRRQADAAAPIAPQQMQRHARPTRQNVDGGRDRHLVKYLVHRLANFGE